MMENKKRTEAKLLRNTRVLFHIKDTPEYVMTNDTLSSLELCRVFYADKNGKISLEGCLLGSIFAHDPYIIPELEEMDCTFEELSPEYFRRNAAVDGLLGLAVGDAFGVPVEFMHRDEVRSLDLQEMVGNDCALPFSSRWSGLIPRGAWSDDSSMTIAAMISVINHRGHIDWEDIMKQFIAWWYEGKYSSLSFPFGLGGNISHALDRFRRGVPALECGGTGFRDNGNGALMRIFPFSLFCILNDYSDEETLDLIRRAAGITHRHEINAMSCYLYTLFLRQCLRTRNPQKAYHLVFGQYAAADYHRLFSGEAIKAYDLLLNNDFSADFNPDCIPESGYVVHSLAIAVYSILKTNNYEDAVKTAVYFGYDTDTNAAITGSIAGAMYGFNQIPERWLSVLRKKDELVSIGEQFAGCIVHEPGLE